MSDNETKKPVLVTGGSGYVASWVIKYFLDNGYPVRTTVRDKSREDKVSHLTEMVKDGEGSLELYEADLLSEGSFKAAMEGCELVVHTASPFIISGIKDAQKQLIEPALAGTRNVLNSATEIGSVKRVVLTSSVVAIYGDTIDVFDTPEGKFTEDIWNTSSSENHQPYSYSKKLAEEEAWRIAKSQDKWDLVVINPGFVLGPSLSGRKDSTSIDFMLSMLNGTYKTGVPKLFFGLVDVRDIARAHYLAGTRPDAEGRHILITRTVPIMEIAQILTKKFGDSYPIPKMTVPKILSYLVGPFFGLKWKYIKRNVGIRAEFDNTKSREQLGVTYHPVEQTILDHAAQIIDDGLV